MPTSAEAGSAREIAIKNNVAQKNRFLNGLGVGFILFFKNNL
jgi:hypothetical protein